MATFDRETARQIIAEHLERREDGDYELLWAEEESLIPHPEPCWKFCARRLIIGAFGEGNDHYGVLEPDGTVTFDPDGFSS